MIAIDALSAQRAAVRESEHVGARDDDLIELMHALGAGVQPGAVVGFLEEGGEGGELIRLKVGAKATARVVDVLNAVRADGAGALVVATAERAASNRSVAVGAEHEHVALLHVRASDRQVVVVGRPLGRGGGRDGRVAGDDEQADLFVALRIACE